MPNPDSKHKPIIDFIGHIRLAWFFTIRGIMKGNKLVFISIIVLLAIVFLNVALIRSLFGGLKYTLQNNYIDVIDGHINMVNKEGGRIQNSQEILNYINNIDSVKGSTAILATGSEFSFQENRTTSKLSGIDVDSFSDVFIQQKSIIQGRALKKDDVNKIILGEETAGMNNSDLTFYQTSLKKVEAGDTIKIRTGLNTFEDFEVVGIFSNNFDTGDIGGFITQTDYQRIFKSPLNQSDQIYVRLEDLEDLDKVAKIIAQKFPELKITKWDPEVGVINSLNQVFVILDTVFTVITFVISTVTILIVTYIDLVSKSRTIGIERALGISNISIEFSYIFRSIILASLGSLIGFTLLYTFFEPLSLANPISYPFGWVSIKPDINNLWSILVLILGASVFAAYIPAKIQNKKTIIKTIWG